MYGHGDDEKPLPETIACMQTARIYLMVFTVRDIDNFAHSASYPFMKAWTASHPVAIKYCIRLLIALARGLPRLFRSSVARYDPPLPAVLISHVLNVLNRKLQSES